jgi:predicted 3-demethylubiquinone-9 3-methyltransferase (glyoxalase superfamily)
MNPGGARGHTDMPTITPCLWFDGAAEDAANHYVSIFPNSRITGVSRYNDAVPSKAGKVLTVEFELDGQPFQGLNGGPQYEFTPALSLSIDCADQAEVDHYWSHLSDGGEELPCGWVTDRYGVPWQVVPRRLPELLTEGGETAKRVMECMFTMKKLDVAALEEAAAVPA